MVVRLLAVISLLAYSGLAFSQVSADGYNCPEDAGGVNSCTANEVNIANTTEVFTDALVCPEGEQILITGIRARYGLNTGLRYDPLLWIGQTGTDPRESGGSCFVSSAPEFAGEADLFQDLDGDSCLDITDPGDYDTVPDPVELDYEELNFLIDCQDADEDGTADVHVVVTWLQNTSLQCGTGPGQSFAPGAPSKCDYNLIPLNIPYVGPKPSLTIIKNVVNDNGGTATSAEWTMDITGGDPSQNNFPGAPAPGVTVTINADEAYSVDESGGPDGYSKSLSPGCSGTLGSGEMATCIITNDDIAPELTVIKHVDNSLGGSAVASDWDMIVTALNPSDDIFPGSEAGVTITIDANSPYSVDESTGPADYIKTIGPGCSGTLLPGEVASCTITNTHPGPNPMLKVIKEVVNNNGGDAVPSDWQMDITATNPSDNNFPGSEAGVTISIEPGAYSVSESLGQSGYAASFSAGCSGTLALNEMATCTITNDDIAPELTIIKHVVNTGGGTAVAGDWNMIVTANNPSDNNFPGSEAGVTITIDANAPYSVDENDGPDDYSKTIGPGCSGTLLPGETSECTITNTYVPQIPRLTLNKVVINDNGGNAEDTDWILEAAGPDSIAGVEGSAAVTDAPVDEGDYALSEPGPDGYELVDISCSGGVLDEETSILTLVPGDDVTCTFTNDDIAPELTITKHVVNIGGGTAVAADWNMLINEVANPSDNNFPGSEAGVTITIDANSPYNVDESTGPDNYIKAIGPGCSGELGPGEAADCTITNTYGIDLPVLTLLKDVINEVDGVEYGKHMDTDWILSAGGPVVRVGVEGDAEVTGTTVLPGSYVLSELGPEGYTASDWQCDGGSLDADMSILDLANGDDVTCTITNTVIPPELKLIKEVVGGPAGPDDFGISVNDDEVLSGDFYQYPAHEPLEIDEDGYTDYVFAGISGDSKCPMMLKGTLQLDEGESVTCTITNVWEPDPPVLTLVKVVINDDGGDQLNTDWTLMADNPVVYREGPTGSEPVTNTLVSPGTYTLSEDGPQGYAASDWMCDGGLLEGDQLTLSVNEVVTCTITNDDIAPTVTLTKHVFAGAAGPDDFGISVDGDVVLSGVEYEYLANDPMPVDEDDVPDYVLVNVTGDAGCPPVLPGMVELDEGEELSCTINNIFHIVPAILTLVKDVVNDDGGDQIDTDWTLIADGPAYREGIEGSEPVTASKVLPGTYSLEEEGPPGYTAGEWQCNGGLLIGNQLTLVEGEDVTCTIVNDDQPGKLTVIKVVEDGSAEADDFALTVNGSGVLSGETIEYPSNMALSIDEADLPNYVFDRFSGSSKCPLALGGSVSLDEGEEISCTITNIHYLTPGSLTLRKSVINDDGGSRVDTDWQLEAFGPVVRVGKDGSDAVTGSPRSSWHLYAQ